MRILLAEDDSLLADGLTRALRQSGYVVDWAEDGKQADSWLASQTYDLAILDLGLPGLEGGDVLHRLRTRKQRMPVLILSAREALEERVRLLDLGADDYLVKPVALSELEARVRALIRRGRAQPEPTLTLGKLTLDTNGRRAWLDGAPLDLTAREWAALEYLATRANRIVSKEQIMESLYSWEEDITPNAVEKFVSRLRVKLEPAGIVIRTVRGLGYYLEKPNEPAA
ncbi:MAG: DNA-binding response regulator [Candidatus Accumulibacter sp. 66-26]|nr:MAG: DNA-binding response regulator [Candidatus Accumulibacter sp. 66-26]